MNDNDRRKCPHCRMMCYNHHEWCRDSPAKREAELAYLARNTRIPSSQSGMFAIVEIDE